MTSKRKSPKKSKSLQSRSRSSTIKRSRSISKSHSPKISQTYKGDSSNELNKFFDHIFIMNLQDRPDRFKNVTKQFFKHGVKFTRFNAIDGRCKDCSTRKINDKRKEMGEKYKYKIDKSLPPSAAAHILGTIQLCKEQIKNKWKRILIFEDDMVFRRGMMKRFYEGIDDLPSKWDLFFLGCGNRCGYRGISEKKTKQNKYLTPLSIVKKYKARYYVDHKDDLRTPCEEEDCPSVKTKSNKKSKFLSQPDFPTGNWAYSFSLSGAKKFIKFLDGEIWDHTDQLLAQSIEEVGMKVFSFDRPIVMHEKGALRPDSDIDWDW